jgi:putative PIN family toxin of toxin-antitoxin system
VLQEIEDVLSRADVLQKLRLTFLEARALVILLQRQGSFIDPALTIRRSRDPDDDKFLECAVGGQADYIVTADNDLLSLGEIEHIPIVDIPMFWRVLTELD